MTDLFPPAKNKLPSFQQSLNKNDFKNLNSLGEGSFGKVFRVNHLPTGVDYAVKVVPKEKIKTANMIKQITNEILIMQSMDHPNIVKLITYFENTTNVYLVMELGGVISLISDQLIWFVA